MSSWPHSFKFYSRYEEMTNCNNACLNFENQYLRNCLLSHPQNWYILLHTYLWQHIKFLPTSSSAKIVFLISKSAPRKSLTFYLLNFVNSFARSFLLLKTFPKNCLFSQAQNWYILLHIYFWEHIKFLPTSSSAKIVFSSNRQGWIW